MVRAAPLQFGWPLAGMWVVLSALAGCLSDPTLQDCRQFPNAAACRDGAIEPPDKADASPLDSQAAPPPNPDMSIVGGPCEVGEAQACNLDVDPCGSAMRRCLADGQWSLCEPTRQPSTELCNGDDDDCDGAIDEQLSRACGVDVGTCSTGVESCNDGRWEGCDAEFLPGELAELCNFVDEDCDGRLDEEVETLYRPIEYLTRGSADHSPSIATSGEFIGIAYARQSARSVQGLFFERRDDQGERIGEVLRLDTNADAVVPTVITHTAVSSWAGHGEGGFVATWSEQRQNENGIRLYLTYVGPDGQQIGRPVTLLSPTDEVTVARIGRLAAAGSDGDSVAIVLDEFVSGRVYFIFRPGIGPFQNLVELVTSDGWEPSLASLGGERFVLSYGSFRSRLCMGRPCSPNQTNSGLYFVEYDGTQLLRAQRVHAGDTNDAPFVVPSANSLILIWEAYLLGDYLIQLGFIDMLSWAEIHDAPRRLDRGNGTARRPLGAEITDATGQPMRLAVVWADERTEDSRFYVQIFHHQNGQWDKLGKDQPIFENVTRLTQPGVTALGLNFAIVGKRDARPDSDEDEGIVFGFGPLNCQDESRRRR